MKKYSVRMLTWLLVLVMAFSGMAMAETATPAEATAEAPNTVTTITAAAEYLGTILNASVELGTDEDGCQQITVNAPYLQDTLFVQLGESAVVVRYGGEAVELSYDVLSEALGMYSYMSSGLDAETAKKLYTYVNGGDAQQDELVWQSILNTEMNRLLSLVMERGLFRMTEEGGFEINATVQDVVSLFAEYLTRAAADAQLADALSQLKLWACMGTDAATGTQALLAQMTARAEALKANPLTGVSGGLQVSILSQGSMTLNFDLKVDACATEIHAEMVFDGEQLIASVRVNVGGKCFTLSAAANEDGLNVEFRMTETSATAEEKTLLEGKLTYSEKEFMLKIDTAAGGYLYIRLEEVDYDEYRVTFGCVAGEFALDADTYIGYDTFVLEANLMLADAKARLTLGMDDDDMDGKLDMMGGEDYLTINLHGSDDVFTLNGFGKVSGDTFSVNALYVDTYRGFEGTFNVDVIEEEDVSSIEGSMTYEEGKRYAYDYTILVNGEVATRCTYEATPEGIKSTTVEGDTITQAETTIERTASGMKIDGTTRTYTVDADGEQTELSCVYITATVDGVNFVCDVSVKVMGMEEAMPLMQITGTAIDEENRLAYRIDVDVQGQTMYIEGGVIEEASENENDVCGRLYLATNANGTEDRIDLSFVLTDTGIKLALEATSGGITQSIGSLSVNVETVVPETAPAHVTGTLLTTEQLLQLFAQLAQ
ncbi:MAG: hypothetical protein Q4E18_13125 [Clostridia bacterium]|nr:hypothetical protein [Clostridia bacterium]